MSNRSSCATVATVLALATMSAAALAADVVSLIRLPVAGAATVAASHDQTAARSGSAVDVALSVVGAFEGSRQVIVQANEGVESPSASRVTVIRDGLLDDAVKTERWDIALARTTAGTWEITQITRAWRCRRGPETPGFAAHPCL
jgi:ABC-type amino acid transport substrate-binding protein